MSTQTLATFAVALAILVGFVVWELRVKEPMLDETRKWGSRRTKWSGATPSWLS